MRITSITSQAVTDVWRSRRQINFFINAVPTAEFKSLSAAKNVHYQNVLENKINVDFI